jgi:hypothetical protein
LQLGLKTSHGHRHFQHLVGWEANSPGS